ncbi:hypothetical protein PoB_003179500 [Plakobranchus ocellatus]|uniref:Uncharacterized protein n=1 Tax=Plakobranchus ocellatus TaxID=259542 RepID=A0AAV4AAT7_9GAST|nr:hypothetical protein PoB_003179500 [Plakobranchus ocellatus]
MHETYGKSSSLPQEYATWWKPKCDHTKLVDDFHNKKKKSGPKVFMSLSTPYRIRVRGEWLVVEQATDNNGQLGHGLSHATQPASSRNWLTSSNNKIPQTTTSLDQRNQQPSTICTMPPATSLHFYRKRQTFEALAGERPQNLNSVYTVVREVLATLEERTQNLEASFYGPGGSPETEVKQWYLPLQLILRPARYSGLLSMNQLNEIYDRHIDITDILTVDEDSLIQSTRRRQLPRDGHKLRETAEGFGAGHQAKYRGEFGKLAVAIWLEHLR